MADKIGRNQPCWCGSGKKYKTCHLDSDRGAISPPEPTSERSRLWQRVLFATLDYYPKAITDAEMHRYLGFGILDVAGRDDRIPPFVTWLTIGFRPGLGSQTAVERFRADTRGLKPSEKRLLDSWAASRFSLHSVVAVDRGTGISVQDYFTGRRVFVADKMSSQDAHPGLLILSRVEEDDGVYGYTADGLRLEPAIEADFVAHIRKMAGDSDSDCSDYVHNHEHVLVRLLHDLRSRRAQNTEIRNSDGDELVDAKAYYRVLDLRKLEDALSHHPAIEAIGDPTGGGRSFVWLNRRRIQNVDGHLFLDGDQLRLQVNSERRLLMGMLLLRKMAGDILEFEREESTPLPNRLGEFTGSSSSVPKSDRPSPQEILEFKMEFYRRWLDDRIPALAGQTPREACRLPSGQAKVLALLRKMQIDDDFDFGTVAEALGLKL